MNWTQIYLDTFIPEFPGILNANFTSFESYLDTFYDGSRGILIKPLETTGNVKGAQGEFVTGVFDNLIVKRQYTNLYENITIADYDYYVASDGSAFLTRDPCIFNIDTSLWNVPYEPSGYRVIDVNEPYYKISNRGPIFLGNDNISQIVGIIFDSCIVSEVNDFQILLDPSPSGSAVPTLFDIDSSSSGGLYIELIATDYDASWGSTWTQYKPPFISELSNIGDVYVSNASDGQVLVWRGEYWVAEDVSGTSVSVSDVVNAVDAVDTSLVTYTDAAIVTALDSSFALYETKVNLDSSFYDVYAAMGSGDVTKVYVDGSLATRDASINNNRAKINQLDASVVRIDAYNRIQDTSIYAEVNQIEASIANLDASLDLYLPLTGGTLSGNLTLDNSLIFNDAYISVDNSIFTIKNLGAGGSISIEGQAVAGANRIIFTADPDSSVMIYHPGLGSGYDAKVMTQTDGINVRSTIYADNGTSKVGYGASNIQLLTEGRDSNDNFVIKHNSAGNISLESNNKTNLTINGSTASLAYFGLTKLQTTATGITVTGTITDYIKDSSFNPSDFVWNGVYLDVSTVGTGVSKDYVDGSIAAAVDAVDTSLVTYVDNVIQTGGGDVNWSEGNYGDVQEIVTAVGDGSILASAITTTGNTLDVRHLFGGALWTQYSYVGDIQGKLNASTGKTDLKINTTADGYGMIIGDTGTDHDLTVYGDVSVFGNLRVDGIFEGLDASFALYETILNLDSSFGLYKTKANLDSSFGLYKTKTNLDSSFGLYETKVNLDSSFYDVYASMGSGDVTKVYVDGSLATRDASINNNRAKINQLDASVVRIDAYNRIQDTSIFIIDASVIRINAYNRIQDTSIYAEVNQIEASIANLDTSLDLYLPLTGGTCSGDITATDFNLPSDTRYKNIIKPVDNGLDILSNITPQVFTWKDNRDDYEHIGYIAQELNIVRPELVKWNKEGYATISYSKMSAINTAAILELNKEIADLKKRINILENASTGY